MRLKFWLSSLFSRLSMSNSRRGRVRRTRSVTTVAAIAERLEKRELLSAAPVAAGPETQVGYYPGGQFRPNVASDANGDYVMVWASNGQDGNGVGVFAERFNSSGVAQGNPFLVNNYTLGDQTTPSVAMDQSGDFVVTWSSFDPRDPGSGDIYARMINSNGIPKGNEFEVNTLPTLNLNDGDVHSRIAMDTVGDFVIGWDSKGSSSNGYSVYERQYDMWGTPQHGQTQVNSYPTGSQVGEDGGVGVGMDAAGNIVISWTSAALSGGNSGVDAQRFGSLGNKIGNEFRVNTTTAYNIVAPRLAMSSSGSFIVAWNSNGQDGSGYGVYAQLYNSSGIAQGSQFTVNQYTLSDQYASSVAMDSVGDFAVAWHSTGQDGNRISSYTRLYDLNGNSQGGEFRLSTDSNGNEGSARLALNSTGELVAVWDNSVADGSASGVVSRRFNAITSHAPVGTSSSVTMTENSAYTFTRGNFGFSDPNDSPSNNFVAVKITSLPSAGLLTYYGAQVSVGQLVPVADIDSGRLVFTPTTSTYGNSYTSFYFQVEDDGSGFAGQNLDQTPKLLTVNVNPLIPPPVLAGIEGSALIYSGSGNVVVTSAVTITDQRTTLAGATIQIASGYQPGQDVLLFNSTPNISGVWNAGTGTLILSGSDTVANYQAALRSVSFQNTGTNTTARTISFQVSDGFLSSYAISRVVDAPPNVLSLVTAGSNPASGPAIQFTVTFSEAVTGVSSANFSLVETGWVSATGIQVAAVSSSVYTITVNGVTGTGTLGVNLSNPGNIIDAGNNPLTGKYSGQVVTVDTAPVVTLQPANFSVAAGGAASFTAAASGFPAPGTQWQVSRDNGSTWGNISGATSPTYSFVTSTTDNGSLYRAVFTNAVGIVTSSVATLSVSQAPFVTVYWTGLGDGHSWSNASNWSTHAIPGANDNVLINAASGTVIHGPTAATTVRNLTITSANFFVDGAFLTVTNGVIVGNGQSLTVGNYSSLIPGSISLNAASLTLSQNGIIKGGTVTETGAANIAVVGSGVLDGTTINGNVTVTHANNDSLYLRNTVTLNGTLLIGATDGSTWATVFFNDAAAGAVTLTGNASVVFGGNTTNGINFYDNGGAITLGSNVILHGNNGRIVNTFYTGTVLFQGTIAADVTGGTISFASSTVIDQNTGTLTASNGGTLALNNNWTNNGTVTSTGTGNVQLAGIVNNGAGTINLDGSLTLQQNGTVKGGTINEDANGIVAISGSGILDGTTVNGNVSVTHANNDSLTLRNTVTLNGTLLIGATDGSTWATLFFRDDSGGAVTLAGNASVIFGGNTTNGIDLYDNGGVITLGSNVTLHGKNGRIANNFYTGTVLLQGTVAADVAGGTISFASSTVPYQNSGILTANNGGTLSLSNTWTNTGVVTSAGTGNVLISAGIVNNNSGTFNLDGALSLDQNGTVKGGTINETLNGTVAVVSTGVLDGVTVNGNIAITHASGNYLYLRNTVTLNGTLSIGTTDGSISGTLFLGDGTSNPVTLNGNANIVFGGNTANAINDIVNGGAFTLGRSVVVRGNNGRFVDNESTGTVLNQGTISDDVVGGTINVSNSNATFVNSGILSASNGGTLELSASWKNSGNITSASGGDLLLLGAVDNSQGTIKLDSLLTMQGGQGSAITGGTVTETASGNIAVITSAILDNVIINGNISLTHTTGDYLVLRDTVTLNGTLSIGTTDGSISGALYLGNGTSNPVTLNGNANIVFGGSSGNAFDDLVNGGTFTIGQSVVVHGNNGRFIDNESSGTILNLGTIGDDVSGGNINVANSAATFLNSGTLSASNSGTLELSASWKNSGNITSASGGDLLLLGAVDNSQGTIKLDSLLTMQGGQGSAITGGTVTETVNGNISVITSAILDNVTINGNISLTHGTGEYLILRDTVTLNGTLSIGATDGSTSEVVYFGYGASNPVTLAGNATLVFGGGTNNTIDNYVTTGTTTLASTVTIRGKTGSLINNSATGAILDQGTISADVSGGTITAGNYAGIYQNTGTFKASNGGVLVVSGTGITNSLAGLIESPTGTIQFGSNLLTTATSTSLFDPEGNVTFNLNANSASAKLLEATSQDLGNIAAGFVNNSAFGSLNLTNGTYVKLVNQTHNTGSSVPEAVYVNSLNVAANTTLDLNGLHLYALAASIKGTILNGTINAIGVAPAVTTQPSSTTVLPGTTASFTAVASGTLTPTVQWQASSNSGTTWTNIAGATSATYSFTTASGNNGSQYRAVFTNPSGTATTNAATLTVASANVTGTVVRWGTSGSATLVDTSGGRMLPTGRTNDIDWFNISSGTITLDRSIPSLSPADISVIGSVGGSYGPVTVSGSGTTWVITLAKPIANADKVIVTIGNAQLTSYQRELDILPGDFNDDGVVDSSDVTLLNNATVAPYNVFADLNGDGVIDTNDGILARTKIGTKRIL